MTFEDLQKANETIKTLDVKGKEYAEVNQRIKAFRMLYPEGCIITEMLSNENGVCVFKASVYSSWGMEDYPDRISYERRLLGTGTAYEKEGSTFINKTSYIENCETSAVGRALAMCGIGIDTSIASAEEVQNAINNQETVVVSLEEAKQFTFSSGKYKDKTIEQIYKKDKKYLQWWLDSGYNEKIKLMIMSLTDLKPTEERPQEELMLVVKLQELVNATNTDYESLKKHYGVSSDIEMTKEQLEDAIATLEKRL